MAKNFVPRFISSPLILGALSKEVLCRFMSQEKYRDFFIQEGLLSETSGVIDTDKLGVVLINPNDKWPPDLMADIFYWDEVSTVARMPDLVEIAENNGIEISDDATVSEASLIIRMHAPEDFENLHSIYQATQMLSKKKRFLYFFATPATLPAWIIPTESKLRALENLLDEWYVKQKKGKGTRVSVVDKENSAWFIIRHGGNFKRENARENGESKVMFYRPEAYDLIIYYYNDGELAIYNDSRGTKEQKAYCRCLGQALYGNSSFFEQVNAQKFTLDPIIERGVDALNCDEIEGLDSACLSNLKYHRNGNHTLKSTLSSDDIFQSLAEQGETIPQNAQLISVEFKLVPTGGLGGGRSVRLYSPNVAIFDHESDAEIAHKFLFEQEFILPRPGTV